MLVGLTLLVVDLLKNISFRKLLRFILSAHIQDGSLSSTCGPHCHDTVTNDHGLVELCDLHEGARFRLQPLLQDDMVDGVIHHTIVLLWEYHSRKEIVYNTL